jgi:hypothetical protein
VVHAFRRATNDLELTEALVFREREVEHGGHSHRDGVHRVAEIVCDDAHDLVSQLHRALGFRAGLALEREQSLSLGLHLLLATDVQADRDPPIRIALEQRLTDEHRDATSVLPDEFLFPGCHHTLRLELRLLRAADRLPLGRCERSPVHCARAEIVASEPQHATKLVVGIGDTAVVGPVEDPDYPRFGDATQLCFARTYRLLGFEAVGNIGIGAEPPHRVVVRVAYRYCSRQEPAVDAIFAPKRVGILPFLAPSERRALTADHASAVIRMHELLPSEAATLLEGEPCELVPPVVEPGAPPLAVGNPRHLWDGVRQGTELGFARAQGVLRGETLRDIGIRAEPAEDGAVTVANRQCAGEKPAVLSVLASEREGVFPGRAGREAPLDALNDLLDVVGVVDCSPPPPLHLIEGGTGVVVPALVIPIDPTAWIGHPRELRDGVRERSEPFLLHANRIVGAMALGDVLDDSYEEVDVTFLPADRRRGNTAPHDVGVVTHHPCLVVKAGDRTCGKLGDRRKVGCDVVGKDDVLKRAREEIAAFVPEHLTESIVDEQKSTVPVEMGNADRGELDRGAERAHVLGTVSGSE